ncbi:NADH-quinone oxidoreductase subunit J family protein [Desulfobacca acetoxidans]|uniref:NADH-quinone oxidoreductase subunit J n=1 Tax=Desulfobacca acetoxidans (strain ATCC 700848 / DSM 11109 / ASRB2) TaxID=880072 RepID=F2NHF1_DESAR|nr:NADH-quinone oxidoreductase subunit J [Desulfobacca acetoxidans]AEB09067.1 NADH-ubiquinone/plastoquinone oxidoreductase chain 6 [Desulfobacca acetoxidans DSM 11109]HAY22068.1 NADH-quinone oxidoreductase subunit J [Desulfobacterales bacterium]
MSAIFDLSNLSFLGVLAVTFGGAIIAVGARNIFHNVLGLALSLFGVAGIFVYLNSPFLAMMEILIYVGAICIAICFAIMLSEPLYLPKPPRKPLKIAGAGLGAGVVFLMLSLLIKKTDWIPASVRGDDWSIATIGHYLLTRYALIFEVISLVLLVAMLGAIVNARNGRNRADS